MQLTSDQPYQIKSWWMFAFKGGFSQIFILEILILLILK